MKMKVEVSRLKAAIRKHVVQDQKRFERETAAYKQKSEAARVRYIHNVAVYLAGLREGSEANPDYNIRDRLSRGCHFPPKPKHPETHAALLVKLDLAEDQILTVDDHSDYMKFLDGKCVCR